MLALQRSVGNRAVGAILARAPLAQQPEGSVATKAPTQHAEEAGEGEKEAAAAGRTAVSIEDVGSFDAQSVQWGPQKKSQPKEPLDINLWPMKRLSRPAHEYVVVTKANDALSPALVQHFTDGKPLYVRIYGPVAARIRDAVISSYQAGAPEGGGNTETVTFSGTVEIEWAPRGWAGGP